MKTQTELSTTPLSQQIKKLPKLPGVYLFKDLGNHVIYIGKAKNLKNRVSSYLQRQKSDWKSATIVAHSTTLEHHVTRNELQAMLLEAKLIQNHQPKWNVLLKSGQPFLYIMVAQSSKEKIPTLQLVRNKKKKGIYFGPFIEKGPARKAYEFLLCTFNLKLCNKKIEQGCLYYHLGKCAGSCKSSFDRQGYEERLELAITSLRKGHKKFLTHLKEKIETFDVEQKYEKSREYAGYLQAFTRVFTSLATPFAQHGTILALTKKDVWIFLPENASLYLFKEHDGVLKKQQVFYDFSDAWNENINTHLQIQEYFLSYYRTYQPPSTILANFDLADSDVIEQFLHEWSGKTYPITITQPTEGHFANVVRLGHIHAEQLSKKQLATPQALKLFLKLPVAPRTIDCFDISHKQGNFMVGSCIRFTDGQPDKNKFRRFHIKTVNQIDDYASLREIVQRRYKRGIDLPDLILIDGGKGQLNAVCDLYDTEWASLAKREETVFSKRLPEGKRLNVATFVGQALIALRDYTHHFAISFHRKVAEKISQR